MANFALPRQVESTSSALEIQGYVAVIGAASLVLGMMIFDGWSSPDRKFLFGSGGICLIAGSVACAVSARRLGSGRVPVWFLAVCAEIITFIAGALGLNLALQLSALLSLLMTVILLSAILVSRMLLRTEVRRFFFARERPR